jgi:hypothetical protein
MGAIMKNFVFPLAVACVVALSSSAPTTAQQLIVNGSGQLTSATGININGTLYDVTFSVGSCDDAYSGCNATDFTFSSAADAQAAAQALLDYVFVDGPAGQFDSAPTLTAGCLFSNTCRAAVPYGLGMDNLGEPVVLSMLAANNSAGSVFADAVFAVGDEFHYDATNDAQIWTHFTLENAVPEPATWALMLVGFGAIGGALRRSRKPHSLPQLA